MNHDERCCMKCGTGTLHEHDWYVIRYPHRGNPNDIRYSVEGMEKGKFNHDGLVELYGNYATCGKFEQENWAVQKAMELEDKNRTPYRSSQ